MCGSRTRWGIIGTGRMAQVFCGDLKRLEEAEITAVASRSPQKAREFSARYEIPTWHTSCQELAQDPDVDVVYVATPHICHFQNALTCLRAGKHVLCEKPFTLNADEAAQLMACAREKQRFLMEAMWTRFHPAVFRLREIIGRGAIGRVRMLLADFGFHADYDPHGRLFDPALGGGSLLDVGVYAVSFASMLFGAPADINGAAVLGATGVDETTAAVLRFAGGELALLASAITLDTPQRASIIGDKGRIEIDRFWHPDSFSLKLSGADEVRQQFPLKGNGYGYEAEEVMACLRCGRIESPVMPLAESVSIMQTMDALRRQWGLKYPSER